MHALLQKIIIVLGLGLGLAVPFGAAVSAQQINPVQDPCTNARSTEKPSICRDTTDENPITAIIKVATNIISAIVGVAAVIIIIVSGLRMSTSSGDPNGVSGARNAIIYAAVGLAIVVIARWIILFVINNVST